MGCWAFGGGEYWGPHSQEAANEAVRYAVDHGYGFFDTAESYNDGASEKCLGRAIQGIPREKMIVATKISPCHAGPDVLERQCEASLRRLQTDYIDVYMLHWPVTARAIRHFTTAETGVPDVMDAFGALERLKQRGKIRHIGVSNFGREKLCEALSTGVDIAFNELPYSLLARAIELEILPCCRDAGVGVVGYMTLMQGILSDTYQRLADVPAWRRRTRHFDSRRVAECRHGLYGAEEETETALQEIRRIAASANLTVPQIAIKWAITRPGITSSLCGARSLRHLKENIRAASDPLPADVVQELNRVTKPLLDRLGPSFDYYEHPSNDRTT